mmetsp:Transcript_80210/g.240240  ORF Transcript_80210/g.240240 Transcript_80210/m.240240 type:complete len:285 (+) Transcript_80210:3-857(+)
MPEAHATLGRALHKQQASAEACDALLAVIGGLTPLLGPLGPLWETLQQALRPCLISQCEEAELVARHPGLFIDGSPDRRERRSLRGSLGLTNLQRSLRFATTCVAASTSAPASGGRHSARRASGVVAGGKLAHYSIAERYTNSLRRLEEQMKTSRDVTLSQQKEIASREAALREAKAALEEKAKAIDLLVREAQAEKEAIGRQYKDNDKEALKYSEQQDDMVEMMREGHTNQQALQTEVGRLTRFNRYLQLPVAEARELLEEERQRVAARAASRAARMAAAVGE